MLEMLLWAKNSIWETIETDGVVLFYYRNIVIII